MSGGGGSECARRMEEIGSADRGSLARGEGLAGRGCHPGGRVEFPPLCAYSLPPLTRGGFSGIVFLTSHGLGLAQAGG